jgi:hypothetical protein
MVVQRFERYASRVYVPFDASSFHPLPLAAGAPQTERDRPTGSEGLVHAWSES